MLPVSSISVRDVSLNLGLPEDCLVGLFVPVSAVPVCARLFLAACDCRCCDCLSLTLDFFEQHRKHYIGKEWDTLQNSLIDSFMRLSL